MSERQKGSKWFVVSAALSRFLPQLFSLKTGTSKQQVSFFFFLLTSGGVSEKQDYDVAPDLLPGGRLAFFSVLAKDRGPLGERNKV